MSTKSEVAARRRHAAHALYQEGRTQKQIARVLGVSQKRVSEYLAGPAEIVRPQKDARQRQPPRIQPKTWARIEQAQRLSAAGLSQTQIAQQMNVTQACISTWLKLGKEAPAAVTLAAPPAASPRPKRRTQPYHYRWHLSAAQREELVELGARPGRRSAWTAKRLVAFIQERYGVRYGERQAYRMLRQWFAKPDKEQ